MLQLHTFGGISVQAANGRLAGATAQPRRLAVLAVLARCGARGAARGKLLGLLWPDASDEQGRRVITQALYALRRDLGNEDAIVGTQDVRLNEDVIWCDAFEFDAALSRGDFERATAVYVGPFLDGFRLPSSPEFERWADDERTDFQHRNRKALEQLAKDAESRGVMDEAVKWWRRRVSDDPLSAPAALGFMRALAAAGHRAEAIQHARLFEALVEEELGLPPDRDVIELARSLRESPPSVPSTPTASPVVAASRPASSSIAVLPFALLGRADVASQYSGWCDGLAEELIGRLLDVSGIHVVARSASFAHGPNPTLQWLRDDLRVTHALEGSVQRGREGLRFNVRLMSCEDGRIVWWNSANLPADDDGRSHEAIATSIVDRARKVLIGEH